MFLARPHCRRASEATRTRKALRRAPPSFPQNVTASMCADLHTVSYRLDDLTNVEVPGADASATFGGAEITSSTGLTI